MSPTFDAVDGSDRRSLLGAVASLVALAGCGAPGNDSADPTTAGADRTTPTTTATTTARADAGGVTDGEASGRSRTAATAEGSDPGADSTAATPELDLREANVTGVTVRPEDDGYVFDVTLYHDDDGEPGYANWWQVERLSGERIGRRELAHPHGTREFTRATLDPYPVPDGTACVVVRGHDGTHGYGGRAAVVALESGVVRFVNQGSGPASFGPGACP